MTFDISLDRTSLSLAALVLHGERQDGWCLMPGRQMPAQVPQTLYASSPLTDGATATHSTWQLAFMSGDVVLSGAASSAARADAIAELRAALSRLSFSLTATWGGVPEEWVTEGRCTMTPSPLTYLSVTREEPIYSLNLPVRPTPESP